MADIHERQMSENGMKSRRVKPAYSIELAFLHRIEKIENTFMTPLLAKTQELTVIRQCSYRIGRLLDSYLQAYMNNLAKG